MMVRVHLSSVCSDHSAHVHYEFELGWIANAQWKRFQSFLLDHNMVFPFKHQDPTAPCALCQGPIHLRDATSYSLCAAPYACVETMNHVTDKWDGTDLYCKEAYHLTCLADAYRPPMERVTEEPAILPLAGRCPGCVKLHGTRAKLGSWAYVVRAIFRRKEQMHHISTPGGSPCKRRSPSKRPIFTNPCDASGSEASDSSSGSVRPPLTTRELQAHPSARSVHDGARFPVTRSFTTAPAKRLGHDPTREDTQATVPNKSTFTTSSLLDALDALDSAPSPPYFRNASSPSKADSTTQSASAFTQRSPPAARLESYPRALSDSSSDDDLWSRVDHATKAPHKKALRQARGHMCSIVNLASSEDEG